MKNSNKREREIKMNESVKELLTKMNEDKAFAEKLLTQTEMEKVIELAGAEGIVITLGRYQRSQ
jgi:Holliday junction resolvasome RuvABC endonuclease subunit